MQAGREIARVSGHFSQLYTIILAIIMLLYRETKYARRSCLILSLKNCCSCCHDDALVRCWVCCRLSRVSRQTRISSVSVTSLSTASVASQSHSTYSVCISPAEATESKRQFSSSEMALAVAQVRRSNHRRRRRRGSRGTCPTPPNSGKIFLGDYHVQFGHFSGK